MTRQYSIAEARDRLPRIVHEVEDGVPVELTRRGRPVAVVMSVAEFERMAGRRLGFSEALDAFRTAVDPELLSVAAQAFDDVRDRSPGRDAAW